VKSYVRLTALALAAVSLGACTRWPPPPTGSTTTRAPVTTVRPTTSATGGPTSSSALPATTRPGPVGGLHVANGRVLDGRGNDIVLRGVNHAHTWYKDRTTQAMKDIKATGANSVRVVLSGGGLGWTKDDAASVRTIVTQCRELKVVCVLEDHDTTGYAEQNGAYTLDQAVDYWVSIKSALDGAEGWIILNIGNEPWGNKTPEGWQGATTNALKRLRTAGFHHLIMVDGPAWGQDWENRMRDAAPAIAAADPDANTVFSIHMYAVYNTADKVKAYLDSFISRKLPLVVGEFGWQFSPNEVDDATIMSYAQQKSIGYLGWSWSGNTDPVLDMTVGFNAANLSTWGQRVINGPKGIKATAKPIPALG
jgi:mannan endo-1,4-beta-mannosidase